MEETGKTKEDFEEIIRKKTISELNAHFLFNALSFIIGKERKDSELAQRLTKEFSDYLRIAMLSSSMMGEWIPLSEEMKAVRAYLHIQSLRFPGRITATIEIADEGQMVIAGVIRAITEKCVSASLLKLREGGSISICQTLSITYQSFIFMTDGLAFCEDSLDNENDYQIEKLLKEINDTEDASIDIRKNPEKGVRIELILPI